MGAKLTFDFERATPTDLEKGLSGCVVQAVIFEAVSPLITFPASAKTQLGGTVMISLLKFLSNSIQASFAGLGQSKEGKGEGGVTGGGHVSSGKEK